MTIPDNAAACHCPHVREEHCGPGGACIGTVIEFGCEVHCRCTEFVACEVV